MEGAHPTILQALLESNLEKTEGYGFDPYCDSAKEKIRAACRCPNAEIHFLVGGTQTNAKQVWGYYTNGMSTCRIGIGFPFAYVLSLIIS